MLGKEITDIKPNGWTLLNRDSPVMKTDKDGKIPIKPALLEVIISLHIANYPTYKKPSHRSINNKLNQPKVSWTTILGLLQGNMIMLNKSRKEDAGLTSILTPSKTIRLATWNIRTIQKAGRTEKVAKAIVSRD